MNQQRGRTLPVLIAAATLVAGANVAAYAVNGQPLLAGRSNTETQATTIKNTGNGPALKLNSKPSAPPLAVSSTKRVKKLNADRVDGLHGKALQTGVRHYVLPPSTAAATSQAYTFPDLPNGRWLANYSIIATGPSVVTCFFREGGANPVFGVSFGAVRSAGLQSANSAAVLSAADDPILSCNAGDPFAVYSTAGDAVSTVVMTRVDTVRNGTSAIPSRPATGSGKVTGPQGR